MWSVKADGKVSSRQAARHKYSGVSPRNSSSTSSAPVVRVTAGIMWRRTESRACDGSIGGGKTRNRIEWGPGHMEL